MYYLRYFDLEFILQLFNGKGINSKNITSLSFVECLVIKGANRFVLQ